MTPADKRPLYVTAGDPCGIGPEVAVAALAGLESAGRPLVLVATEELVDRACAHLAQGTPELAQLAATLKDRLGRDIELNPPASQPLLERPGEWDPRNADYIEEALDMALSGARRHGGAVTTGPADKRFFAHLGFVHAGHTEFLADYFATPEPLMMFDAPTLRVAVMTRHIPLQKVADAVRFELLERGVSLACNYLRRVDPEGSGKPVAIAALDPHAGEWGAFSNTDLEIRTWVETLSRMGQPVAGPVAADTLFVPDVLERYAAVLCWYHDQGMVPVKMLAFDAAVNVTLGLPVWRTSPAHGVAYDIAWKRQPRFGSFRRALEVALRL